MRRASEVYEAEVVPIDLDRHEPAGLPPWVHKVFGRLRPRRGESADPVVANIVVIDLRSGAERVEISVTGAEVSSTLAQVHEDLDGMSIESFDETWGVVY